MPSEEKKKTTTSYDNAIKGQYLDGLLPARSGNPEEQSAHLLNHYFRMCMDGEHHVYDSDSEAEITKIVELMVNAAISYSAEISTDQVKMMLEEKQHPITGEEEIVKNDLRFEYAKNLLEYAKNHKITMADLDDILKEDKPRPHDTLSQAVVEFHPRYPGAVKTFSLRGAAHSGNNEVDFSVDQDVVSHVAHNYYEVTSSEASLQNCYVALRYTLPDDFVSWADMNAIQIEFRTESATYLNSHVSAYVYYPAASTIAGSVLDSNTHNAQTEWSVIILDAGATTWKAGDVLELYIDLAARNNYFARAGTVTLNYVKSGISGEAPSDDAIEKDVPWYEERWWLEQYPGIDSHIHYGDKQLKIDDLVMIKRIVGMRKLVKASKDLYEYMMQYGYSEEMRNRRNAIGEALKEMGVDE